MFGRFCNLFDSQAAAYSKFRPNYPEELFQIIKNFGQFGETAGLAVDLATGSGQTALHLTSICDKVLTLWLLTILLYMGLSCALQCL